MPELEYGWQTEWMDRGIPEEQWPLVNPCAFAEVLQIHRRLPQEDNPCKGVITVKVLDEIGKPLQGMEVGFETEPSEGIAYDHPDVWGVTDEDGYLTWTHLHIPTRYILRFNYFFLIERIRTDLPNEYYRPVWPYGNRPVHKPGWYSYDIVIQLV